MPGERARARPGPGCFECQDITSSKLVGLRRFFEHGAQKDALHLRTFTHARALRICLHPPFARHYNLPAVCAWLKDASLWATHEPLWSGGLSLFRKARACLWRDGYTRFSFRLCIVLGAILQANLFSRCQSSSKDHWSLVRLYGRRVVHRNLRSRVWAAQCHGVGLCKCRLQICGAAARPTSLILLVHAGLVAHLTMPCGRHWYHQLDDPGTCAAHPPLRDKRA